MEIIIRPSEIEDLNFIYHSFVTSFRRHSWFKNSKEYFNIAHGLIDTLVNSGNLALVAAPKDNPSTLAGWSLGNTNCLHYVYVKSPYRGQDIATHLIKKYKLTKNPICLLFTPGIDSLLTELGHIPSYLLNSIFMDTQANTQPAPSN